MLGLMFMITLIFTTRQLSSYYATARRVSFAESPILPVSVTYMPRSYNLTLFVLAVEHWFDSQAMGALPESHAQAGMHFARASRLQIR